MLVGITKHSCTLASCAPSFFSVTVCVNPVFTDVRSFFDISLDLLRFVYLYHSDIPCLVTDANLLLRRIITNGNSGSDFLGSDKLLAIIRAVAEDAIPSLRVANKAGPSIPPLPHEMRSGFYTAFMSLVEARDHAGYNVENVVSKLATQMISQECLFENPAQTLMDLIALSRGIQQPATLLVMLERVLDNKSELMRVMDRDTNCATLVARWLVALCTLAQHLLRDSPINELHWCLSSYVMRALNHFFDLVSFPSPLVQQEDFGEQCGPNGEESLSQSNPTMLLDFDPDRVEATVVYDLSEFLYCMCCAPWSNLGIMYHYERLTVEKFFSGSVQFFTFLPVDMLMSSEVGRDQVFRVMFVALATGGPVFEQLHQLLVRLNLWDRILRYLTKCLAYFYLPVILDLMFLIVHKGTAQSCDDSMSECDKSHRDAMAGSPPLSFYTGLTERTLGLVLREVVVLVAVSPHLEKSECIHAFFLIEKCFRCARALCMDHFVRLLDMCSAYHRVRIRHIMNNLQEGHNFATLMNLYLRCFGQSSKVSILAAW
ncbi:unnamed protein product [Phytomonas sp. EM1]|nr:unnamed protein product [Phytomonas sp. EM1]|eukprot:CCW63908.1 unnamed protein product [Phytomonas sp. isolate EM1]